jgi:bile acid:Na+ symporter, BASS family
VTVMTLGAALVTVLLMVTVGIELTMRDFREVVRRKRVLFGTLFLPVIILPLIALALTRALSLPPHVTAGVLLLAACPVGDLANVYTLLARGNLALSVTANTLSCLFSAATMAVAFAAYDQLLGGQLALALPTAGLVLRLTLMVALPVLAGMGLRRWRPAWVAAHRSLLRTFCLVGIVFLVVYVLMTRWTQVAAEWHLTALVGVALMLGALVAGLGVARLLRVGGRDGVTVAITFAVRNVGSPWPSRSRCATWASPWPSRYPS